LVSIREIYAKTLAASESATNAERASYDKFIGELAWREFDGSILATWPEVLELEFNPDGAACPGAKLMNVSNVGSAAKPASRSSMPGCANPLATGFMHNRVRMIVAMFLTKDLQIDWRHGEAYFMRQLVDGEYRQQQRRLAMVSGNRGRRRSLFPDSESLDPNEAL